VKYLSVCSGIEAASVAWHPLGWQPVAFSEIEPFPSAVLAHHYPTVPNLGDMTRFEEWPVKLLAEVDILVGGSPCQAFSVAGKRESLADARGNLTLVYTKLLEAIDEQRSRAGRLPAICIWENVPGVLSTKDNAFGCFLAGLVGEEVPLQAPRGKWKDAGVVVGPERLAAWRILDAQFFGVAQRRRRVFLVSVSLRHPRAWACAAAVLPLIESVQRNPAPSREARQGAAASVGGGPDGGRIAGTVSSKWSKGSGGPAGDECYNMVAQVFKVRGGVEREDGSRGSANIGKQAGKGYLGSEERAFTLAAAQDQFVAQPIAFHNRQDPDVSGDITHPLGAKDNGMAVAFHENQRGELTVNDTAQALRSNAEHNYQFARIAMQVRRLTPTECERLQGFPDGYTAIPWRKKPEAPDGPRYKALGNSMAVPCMAWLGQRIAEVDRGD
jgi:DNA (cytosine-5)-methyltransferase 1